jgi:hypothetical protein
MITALDLRLSPAVLNGIARQARISGLTVHGWSLAVLDEVARIGRRISDLPAPLCDDIPLSIERAQRLKLQLIDERRIAYGKSAARAHMPIPVWAAVILSVYSGISDLDEQLGLRSAQ